MKITKRGSRPGTTHRLMMSFAESTYKSLRDQSAKSGYSIAGVVRQVIGRAVAAGLLDADTPSPQGDRIVRGALLEQYYQLVDDLQRAHERRIAGLLEDIAIKDRLIDQMKRGLEMNLEIITEQAVDLQFYRKDGVRDVVPGSTPGTSGD